MRVKCRYSLRLFEMLLLKILFYSIYQVHDELKDKDFRYEMSLVGKETGGLHLINPARWHAMAIEAGEAFKNEDDSDNEI